MQQSSPSQILLIIAGPTAVGKTELCVKLAQFLKTEIISADSRQFYRELNIGTAKPNFEEMHGIPHHFINSHSIEQYYSVGDYERDVIKKLDELFKQKDIVILTGGSGMFIKAITHGIDEMPDADLVLREQLMLRLHNEGLESLQQELQKLDPAFFDTMDTQNSQRVVRALEVCLASGRPFSSFRTNESVQRPFQMIKICLNRDRTELYQRINLRMDQMLADGLVEEAKYLIPYRHHNALQTVGYKEVFDFFDGITDYDTMVELLKRNSRRYAKRQITWFKNQDDFQFLDCSAQSSEKVIRQILRVLEEK